LSKKPKKDRRMKVLWSSNSPWSPSGYGVQTKDLLLRFIKDDWKFAVSCFYGLEGGFIDYQGIPCFPKIGQPYGGDALVLHSREFQADLVMTFQDIWPVHGGNLFTMAAERKWIPYVPIDWFPVAPNILERLKHAYRILTFSRAGHKALQEKGLQSDLILEATDIDIFKPMDRDKIRKQLNIPQDMFLFGMVAANKDNPPRKCFQQCMDAFKRFQENHKDIKCGMYFQTMLEQGGGFNIKHYAVHLGIHESIYYPPPYNYLYKSPHPVVAKIVNSFDVLLNPSNSEGFGLPIIEAQACGVPVITNDWASQPELVIKGKTGLICKGDYKIWSPNQSYKTPPNVEDLYDKMEEIFRMDRKKMAKDCRKHIVENYDINDRVKNKWIPYLEKIQAEILNQPKIIKSR